MKRNTHLVPKGNTEIALRKAADLLRITDSILTLNDTWFNELIDWADEYEVPEYIFPRDKKNLLIIDDLQLWEYQFTRIPESIGKLGHLTKMSLNFNQLSTLPESIGKLNHLTVLSLWENKIILIRRFYLYEHVGDGHCPNIDPVYDFNHCFSQISAMLQHYLFTTFQQSPTYTILPQ